MTDDEKAAEGWARYTEHESEMYEPCKFYDRTGYTSFDDLVKRAFLAGIEHERRKHRWIPVTERLPEQGEHVLVFAEYSEECIVGWLDSTPELGEAWVCEYREISSVTHWMPLPDAPHTGKEEK